DNTQKERPGQVILEIDSHDYEIAFERARGDLGVAVRNVCQLFFYVEELRAKQKVAESDLIKAKLDYQHRRALVPDLSVSRAYYEHSETGYSGAMAAFEEVGKELARAIAAVENATVETHPQVVQAKAAFRRAYLDLSRCRVKAPSHGIITQRKVQVG